jgi:serine/threonine-protein kinase RIM15
MMRTNSRGSVISVEDVGVPDSTLPSSPPPMITEDAAAEEYEGSLVAPEAPSMSLTPPVQFPQQPGDDVADFVIETPKAQKDEAEAPIADPDPTPKAKPAELDVDVETLRPGSASDT